MSYRRNTRGLENGYRYREEYFRRNKGILGLGLYKCPYCWRIVTRKNAHVDHIMPKSRAFGANAYYNTIATCKSCNLKKSNKIDHRVIMGYSHKAVQEVSRGVKGTAKFGIRAGYGVVSSILGVIINLIRTLLGTILKIAIKFWWIIVLYVIYKTVIV